MKRYVWIFLVVAAVLGLSLCLAHVIRVRKLAVDTTAFASLPWVGGLPCLGRLPDSLPQHEIDDLAVLSQQSVRRAGKRIGAQRLSFAALEETYLRILIAQGTLTYQRAFELWQALHGVEGFRTTLRKISSSNTAQRKGHMFELELAEAARSRNLIPHAVGKKFNDGIKRALTDLDVWLKKGEYDIFIEAKNYENIGLSSLPNFRADMLSLNRLGHGLRVFAMRRPPSGKNVRRLLESAARLYGVTLLYGEAAEIVRQIEDILQ